MTKMDSLKIDKKCVDCVAEGRNGVWPPECMDFDHRDPTQKSGNIRQFLHHPELLEIEIAKCDLVCANHHRIRSRRRGVTSTTRIKIAENHVGMTGRKHSAESIARMKKPRHTSDSIRKMLASRIARKAANVH